MVRVFRESPKNIKKYYEKNKPDIVIRELNRLEITCEKFRQRISRIKINDYDKRFPVQIIKILKTRVYNALTELPIKTKRDLESGKFRESLEYADEESTYMIILKNEVYANYPGYKAYREMITEEERKRYC